MHIKQVNISGFRSFRSQTSDIEPFSSKHNVIVGRNGSGKSNFFDAIQFVLVAPKFSILRQEDRQNLLHEGAGSSVMAAYVEIVFDNSDGRFSVDSDEVIIRRTIGHKKDEFFLNRKRIQKNEVISLLESAGFSKSNPYYIVQQGKVNRLCTMKDKDRLNLLKEVAGTTVYEERRAESIKIMEETASKQGKVDEVLQFIEERLNELNQEKEELVEYEQLDKQRRALEWNLYQKETQRLNLEYDSIETERDNIRKEQQSFYTMIRRLQDEISSLEDNMNNLRMTVDRLNKRKVNKEDDMNQINEKRAMIESQIQDLELTIQSREKSLISYREQLQEIEEQLNESKQQLDVIEPSYQEKKRLLFQQTNQLNQMKARIDSLYGKQGRSQQFTTKAERNKFLTTQINRLKDQFNKKQQSGQQIIQKIEQDTQRIKTEEEILNKLDHEQQNHVKQIEQLNHQIMEQITQRNTFQEEKKLHQREIEKLYEQLHDARQDLEKGKAQLNRSLPQHISQGLAMIETIVAEKKIRGYYGPVIDNINLKNPSFRTAVEVAAGNQLFNVIVDNDATAAILIEELEKLNAGRLTFLPLNRLKLRSVSYPENHPNVKALIDVAIDYEEEVERAIRLVFGMKLIAKDLEIATEAARQFNMDTLTIDGDIVNHRGAIEGGYHDERLSKILAVERIRDSSQKIQQFDEKEKQYQQRLHQMDVKISSVLQALHTLENNKHHLQLLDERHMKEIITKRRLIYNLQSNIQEYQKNRDITENEIETLTKTIQNYEEELDLPLHSNLTEAERNELQTLEDQQKQVSHQVDILKKEVVMLENSREEIETNIQTNLQKRKEELEYLLSDTATTVTTVTTTTVAEEAAAPSSGRKGKRGASAVAPATTTTTTTTTSFRDFPAELASLRTEYESLERVLETTRNDYQEIMNNILSKSSQLNKYEIEVENKREQEKQYHDQLNEINNALGKLYTKKEVLQSSLETRQRAIRDLGSIPQKEQDEFKAYSEKQLTKRLNEVTGQSKKFAHVNRKALDQFLSFHEQRESLLKRKEEMLRDTKAIEELIQSLDMQKDEAINRTFTSVSQHFADVFQELVPNGYGKLIMKTVLEEGGDSEEEVEEEEEGKKGKASSKKKGKKATSSPSISGSNGNGPTEDHVLNEEGSATAGGRVLSLPLDSYRGIQVIVSFNKSTGEQFSMQQLSGGQKALVALALIFSIQRCDPAPFYLFDEIDQALDTNYRKAVANLIYRQANSEESPAQFITTTFRPEFVEVADRCFGIALTNKVSNLYALEKADAQDFVTNLMLEEEAVGKASAIPTFSQSRTSTPGGRARVAVATPTTASPIRGRNLLEEDEEEEDEELEGGGEEEEELRRKTPKGKRGSRNRSSSLGKSGASSGASSRRKRALSEEEEEEEDNNNDDDDDAMEMDD